jgi:hypothetical protein
VIAVTASTPTATSVADSTTTTVATAGSESTTGEARGEVCR